MARLRALGDLRCHMLAHQSSHREDAGAAVPTRPGGPTDLGEGASAGAHGGGDGLVVDDVTVADDHGIPLWSRQPPQARSGVGEAYLTRLFPTVSTLRRPLPQGGTGGVVHVSRTASGGGEPRPQPVGREAVRRA